MTYLVFQFWAELLHGPDKYRRPDLQKRVQGLCLTEKLPRSDPADLGPWVRLFLIAASSAAVW